ncbi:hypothetical protein PUN28_010043 [Cardiocondyla obscurior]|uniref:Uncharacterized protein n=1 Tax=Cardiocondyla obscurior TaxID=286306 RepID=A0AAW2FN89_9HYME
MYAKPSDASAIVHGSRRREWLTAHNFEQQLCSSPHRRGAELSRRTRVFDLVRCCAKFLRVFALASASTREFTCRE